MFKIDQIIEKLITENSTEAEFEKAAVKQGMLTMKQDAILKMLNGMTSFDEIERVIEI